MYVMLPNESATDLRLLQTPWSWVTLLCWTAIILAVLFGVAVPLLARRRYPPRQGVKLMRQVSARVSLAYACFFSGIVLESASILAPSTTLGFVAVSLAVCLIFAFVILLASAARLNNSYQRQPQQ